MEIVIASANAITATVLALRADSAAARTPRSRALDTIDPPNAG